MSTAATEQSATPSTATAEVSADDQFAAISHEYQVEKRPTGEYVVKDVPIFGENERKGFAADAKYDELWLKRAVKVDGELRNGKYSAPMHFGHHTFAGAPVDAAGHYELTGVRKCKLHGKKLHVAFANLVFKNEAKFERYRSEYPYRSVEISHERPDQINSLALLSSEAPYFQFPMGNHKFGTELGTEQPKAHYFTWQAEATEQFAGFPPKKKGSDSTKAAPAPKYGDEGGDPGEPGVSDGADGLGGEQGGPPQQPGAQPAQAPGTNNNDVVVANIQAMMELLNKLVDHVIKKDAPGEQPAAEPKAEEPDGDEGPGGEDDGDKNMSDKAKNQPIVAASADVASLEGKIVALEAEVKRLNKERSDETKFAALKAELSKFGIANLDEELRKRVADGSADAWASGIKQIQPPARTGEAPSANATMEDGVVAKFLQDHPKADARVVRELAAIYASAPEGHFIRKHTLDRYLAVQLDGGK